MLTDPREAARQELEWRRCFPGKNAPKSVKKAALTYFVESYCKMWTKEGGLPIDWDLWDCQREALGIFVDQRLIIILKTRQLGMSWLACAYVLWVAMQDPNMHIYFQSIGLVEVTEQHDRIKFIYDNLPEWMQYRCELGGKGRKRNDRKSEFVNGSAIHMSATTKRAGHGAAPSIYVLDEFARNELDRMTIRAVMPAVGEVGQVIIISTANGLGNVFEEYWHQAYQGDSNFYPLFFPASAHPNYTPEFLEREKLNYAGDLQGFYEAYPETPEQAFMSSSKCPFDSDTLKAAKAEATEPEVGNLTYDDDGKVVFKKAEDGKFFIWKHPVKSRPHPKLSNRILRAHYYTIGADVAEGLLGGDFSAAVVVDTDTLEVVAMYRAKVKPEHYAYPLEMLARYYNNAWLAVEVNKNADTIVNDLKASYSYLYTRQIVDKITNRVTEQVGFYTSANSKPRIITGLRRAFHDPQKPLRIPSRVILNEMTTYEEKSDGSLGASGQNHDDTVMALAIAIEASKSQPVIPDEAPERYVRDHRSL